LESKWEEQRDKTISKIMSILERCANFFDWDLCSEGCELYNLCNSIEEILKVPNLQRSKYVTLFKIKERQLGQACWQTPRDVFAKLDVIFDFTLDPCTSPDNPLGTPKFYTEKEDGLRQDWGGERVYMNPPYSRGQLDKWSRKAFYEARKAFGAEVIVGLLPLATAGWFKRWILRPYTKILYELADLRKMERGIGIYFWPRRIKFIDPNAGKPIGSPRFDSIVVIWK